MGENEYEQLKATLPTDEENNPNDLLPTIDQHALCSRISEAIQNGDYETLEEILNNHPHMIKARYKFKSERWTEEQEGVTPLLQAATYSNSILLELLLQKGADANEKTTYDGLSPIHMAAGYGLRENYELLLTSGAKTDSRTNDRKTLLHQAAFGGDVRICESVLNLDGTNINDTCKYNCTPIFIAAQEGHKGVVELLIKYQADANIATEPFDETALHVASGNGYLEIVKALLSHSEIDINRTTRWGETALHQACYIGHTEIVQLLIQHEANANIASNYANTALHYATRMGHTKIVEMMLAYNPGVVEKHVNRNAVTWDGYTAIHLAASEGHAGVFEQLMLDQEVDLTISNEYGHTILTFTLDGLPDEYALRVLKAPAYCPNEPLKAKLCRASSNECSFAKPRLRLLLDKQEIGRQDVESILFWALLNGELDLLQKGLQHERLDLGSFFKGSKVPLHVAARLGNLGVIRILVEKGADVDSLATGNSTAIQIAAEHGNLNTVKELLGIQIQPSTDESNSYPKQLQRMIQKDSNGESAISLAVSRQHKSVEEFLWAEFKLHGNRLLASSLSHEEKEEILEIAAKYERPGEESVLKSFLQQNKKSSDGWTALHWAVFRSQPVAVWWLLSKGGYVGTKILQEVRKLDATPSPSDEIIQRLLRDPPPILPTVANNNDDELVQEPSRENDDDIECQGTIVDFYDSGRYTEMHVSHKSVKDIIYQRGVKSLMEESRKQNFHNLDFVKKHIQEHQSNGTAAQSTQETRPDEAERPDLIQRKAEGLTIDPAVTSMNIGTDIFKEREFPGTPKYRWIHIPQNNMKLLEDLVTRISTDEKKTHREHRPLMQFFRESWAPNAVGGGKHYMKTQYVIPYLAFSEGKIKANTGSSKRPLGLPIHESMTLDQYYYVALADTTTRDSDQVLSRYLDRYHEQKTPHMQRILMVADLWIWIIDNKTIITATTDQHTEFVDTVFENIATYERTGKRQLLHTVDDMVGFILGIQITFFRQETIPLNSQVSKSVLNVFRESIRDVTEKESKLYDCFLESLNRDEDERLDSHNNIREEVRLLREIKDIRDELGILVTLVEEQQMVWKQAFPPDSLPSHFIDDCTPISVREDLDEMISDANLVLDSINSLLDLRQKQATIKEAEWGRKQAESGRRQQEDTARQSNIIMVFTVVTIIFLPLSFLSSLFALNVSDFPHEGDSVAYKGWWIFPIIFGISTAVSLPLIGVAFNVNSLLNWFQSTIKAEPRTSETRPESAWHPQENAHRMLRKLAEKGKFRSLEKRPQSTENYVPV